MIYNLKYDLLKINNIFVLIFDPNKTVVEKKYMILFWFPIFKAKFFNQKFEYTLIIPILNVINFKKKDTIKTYVFGFFMVIKALLWIISLFLKI